MDRLNLYQIIMCRVFGLQYAGIRDDMTGVTEVYRARLVGGRYYVYPKARKPTRVVLQGQGAVLPSRAHYTWEPLTEKLAPIYRRRYGK